MLIGTGEDLERLLEILGNIKLKDLNEIIKNELTPIETEINGKKVYTYDAKEFLIKYHPDYILN